MPSINSSVHLVKHDPEKFAVYAGDGRYVSGLSVIGKRAAKPFGFVHFAGLSECLSLARHEAVTACHATRRAGVPAWVVRHPVGALS